MSTECQNLTVTSLALAQAFDFVEIVDMLKTWQYNGMAPWKDIMHWCESNLKGQYDTNRYDTIYFTSEAYTLFLLKWL